MLSEIIDALDRADADDRIRCIIFTGAGRAFCAGADLSAGGKTSMQTLVMTTRMGLIEMGADA